MKKIFKIVINILLILILVYSGFNIYIKLSDYKRASNTYNQLRTTYEETDNSQKNQSLYSINNDFKFWLKVDNTNINYPVVQYKNNSFYLNHDFYKNISSSGSIFMDYRDNKDSQNIILYGHNMKNKTMFNNLIKFKNENFFNENNKIRIIKDNKEYIYEIFSVYTIDGEYNYLTTNFDTSQDFKKYIENIRSKSLFKSNVDVTDSDKIITLSTCSYEFDNARTVVHGKLITTNTKQ
ncbi:peptidase C60B, sortase B,Sortase (surface protein transpeptidase),sortase, SrtB family,Sortase family (plasmid) [[Clostridium] sordellii]|uniref:Peptidase C60B, sortase B n=1 Tax=Paraclostridium sordellii TaxID=1505 RepID=A0ABM9RTX4_PARSO|nr:class B sortase [Paeniclostridium sordellii]CEJ75539.1 putative peptidase C60B, sortase B (plasmid) [[Clostridium] sordellii] [Paeniclostridium sordellii]CEK32699.1 peptidase C60B, sortase B,Sortase (surface protein transpeptidase),sortase, SrtB family,Sortase family (plasmid) [[Clostridium] sordellii] [Paeniclostridium sordellii]CEN22407.1 peptidase C60B [[Clostridium] sordellii] [Paeniclostridium sordellii]CEN29699.1 peptidase C60B [[Clostridium] sordellii] [Paeniclostridium sordellii]